MTAPAWPSRAEWRAKAEYAVRTACARWERLEKGAVWSTLAKDIEVEESGRAVAAALRPLLTAEIGRLREQFPDRPSLGSARALWLLDLPEERYAGATNLAALEGMRTEIGRAAKEGRWGHVGWQLGRIRRHYPAIALDAALLAAETRMTAIAAAADERRDKAAQDAEDAAVAAEVAKRATDAGWERELRRRQRIEDARGGLVVRRIADAS